MHGRNSVVVEEVGILSYFVYIDTGTTSAEGIV